jgi:hypothetical protein
MTEQALPAQSDHQYAIALPCSPEDFGKFIGSLLGKPQTIANAETGAFEIRKDDIVNSYHLVVQRVRQQNDGHLIQFTVRLVFDDNSSVLLNSLEDFVAYTEVRPVVPTQAHLSWTFIVKFPDRSHPEKQEIDLSFLTEAPGAIAIGEKSENTVVSMARIFAGGHIAYRIRHTARTWGADIESLLTGHAKHLLLPQSPLRQFAQAHSGKIAIAVALLFFASTVAACFFAADRIASEQLKLVAGLLQSPNALDLKLNRLLQMTAEGFWGRYFFSVFVFVIFSFVASVLLAIWAGFAADTRRPSYFPAQKSIEVPAPRPGSWPRGAAQNGRAARL